MDRICGIAFENGVQYDSTAIQKGVHMKKLWLYFLLVPCVTALSAEGSFAILPFESVGFTEPGIANVVADFVQYAFVKNYPKLTCIERNRISKILEEQALQLTGATEQACEVGRVLGATSVIYGSISKLGSKTTLFINVGDVQTGRVIFAKSDSKIAEIEDIDNELIFPMVASLFSVEEAKNGQTVTIRRCLNLVGMRNNRYPNAFVEVLVGQSTVGQTPAVQASESANFNKTFEIDCDASREIQFRVYDSGPNYRDLIGAVVLTLPPCDVSASSQEDTSATAQLVKSIANLAVAISDARRPRAGSPRQASYPEMRSSGQYQLIRQDKGVRYRTGTIEVALE